MLPKTKLLAATTTTASSAYQDTDPEDLPENGTYRIMTTFENRQTFERRTNKERNLYNEHVAPAVVYTPNSDQVVVGSLAGLYTPASLVRCAHEQYKRTLLRGAFRSMMKRIKDRGVVRAVRHALVAVGDKVVVQGIFLGEAESRQKSADDVWRELQALAATGDQAEVDEVDGSVRTVREAHVHLFRTIDRHVDAAQLASFEEDPRQVANVHQQVASFASKLGTTDSAPPALPSLKMFREPASRLHSLPETLLATARTVFGNGPVSHFLSSARNSTGGRSESTGGWMRTIPSAFEELLGSAGDAASNEFIAEAVALVVAEVTPLVHGETEKERLHRRFAKRACSESDPLCSYQALFSSSANHTKSGNASAPIAWTVAIDFFLLGFLAFDWRIHVMSRSVCYDEDEPELQRHGIEYRWGGEPFQAVVTPQEVFRERVLDEAQTIFWQSDWLSRRVATCSATVSVAATMLGLPVDHRQEISRLTNAASLAFFDTYFATCFDKDISDLGTFQDRLVNATRRFDAEKGNATLDAVAVVRRLAPTKESVEVTVKRVKDVLQTHSMRRGGGSTMTEDTISRVAKKTFSGSFGNLVARLKDPGFGHLGDASDLLPDYGLEPTDAWLNPNSLQKFPFAVERLDRAAPIVEAGVKVHVPQVEQDSKNSILSAARQVVASGRFGSPARARLQQAIGAVPIQRGEFGPTKTKRALGSSPSPKSPKRSAASPTRNDFEDDDSWDLHGHHASDETVGPSVAATVRAMKESNDDDVFFA